MSAIITRIRVVLVALALACLAAPASASARSTATQTRTTEATRLAEQMTEERPPAGSPEFGVLLIIGIVAFLVFAAWLFSRVGDDTTPRGDQSII